MTFDEECDETIKTATAILPAWFIPRMMDDVWSFGLLLTTGQVMCISTITQIHRGEWLDVELLEHDDYWVSDLKKRGFKTLTGQDERLTASVNISQIVAAFELANT